MPVQFFMGSLKRPTGGAFYNKVCIEALRAAGHQVDYRWVSPYQAATLVGLLPRVGSLLCSPLLALALAWKPGTFIVDEHFLDPMLVTNFLRRRFGRGNLIVVVHHIDDQKLLPLPSYRRRRFEAADLVVAVSRFSRGELLNYGVPESKIVLVPPGFEPRPRLPRVPRTGPLRCLAIGRCSPRKGWDLLLRAMAELGSGQAQLNLVGDYHTPFYKEKVEPLFRRYQLRDRVRFLGRVSASHLDRLFSESDVLVHPSRKEGFGIVLLEALHQGLPVIASRISAIPELVEHERHGLLCEPECPRALAAAIQRLVQNPELVLELGQRGPARAGHYSWERTQQNFLQAVEAHLS